MTSFVRVEGIVTFIEIIKMSDNDESACNLIMSVNSRESGEFNLVVTDETYFVNHANIKVGDSIVAFYDALAPVPLIFPPRFRAIVIGKKSKKYNIKVDNFDEDLVSGDGTLRLNIGHKTRVVLENGQTFLGKIENRDLVVVYGSTTRSIPAMTTPYEVVVLCPSLNS